jgi:hypothetical protein
MNLQSAPNVPTPPVVTTTIVVVSALIFILVCGTGLAVGGVLVWNYLEDPISTSQPNSSNGDTATIWPTIPVTELPQSGAVDGESPLEAAATMAPTGTPLIEIFQSVGQAQDYWNGYHPSYPLSVITTAGVEGVFMATDRQSLEFVVFGHTFLESTRLEVGATVHGGILVGITRQAIIDGIENIDIQPDGSIKYLVNLPPECALLLAIPVSDFDDDDLPIKADIDLDQISIPSAWATGSYILTRNFYNETQAAENAILEATYQVFLIINEEDRLHQSHVMSVESPSSTGLDSVSGQHAYPIISDIVKEAICWKMAQNNVACDPSYISGEIHATTVPDRLRRCGTGEIFIDQPYGIRHVTMP